MFVFLINKFMVNLVQTWSSGLSVSGGRCLRKKWLNPGIMNGTIANILTIYMTWSFSGYAFLTWNWANSLSFIFHLVVGYWYIYLKWLGEEERFLVALCCDKTFEWIHSKTLTRCRWSHISGG